MRTKPVLQGGIALGLALVATAAMAAPATTLALLNGKDLTGWKKASSKAKGEWQFGEPTLDSADAKKLKITGPGNALVSVEKSPNLVTEASFGDCRLELEFMVSKNSNSGVKMMNIYEIQIFDSFGKAKMGISDCGAVYDETAPAVNACKAPGEWQTLLIDFRAPRFDAAGQKTANAKFVKVALNGQVVQDNVEIAHGTNVSRKAPEHPTGPILLQGDHGPVAFRNIKLTPLN